MLKKSLLLVLSLILLGCGIKVEDVQSRMEEALHSKYGEEFVVENIGLREANGQKFYQARIYPKSIIGTNKENDSYYYATSSINLKSPNKLSDGVGDSYWEVKMNDDAENYLLSKAKEIFGDRIRLKTDIKYKKRVGDSEHFAWYKKSNLDESLNDVRNDEENKIRFEVGLYIYIFDRIETDEELEGRREETFEFIQYLKKEKLFEYLEMGVIFLDERVLAPSYKEQAWKLSASKKEEIKVGEKTVFLPRKEVREQLSGILKEEIDKLTEEELIQNMNRLKKSELEVYKGSEYLKWNAKDYLWVESYKHLKEVNVYGGYREAKEKNTLLQHHYNSLNDIEHGRFNYYIY